MTLYSLSLANEVLYHLGNAECFDCFFLDVCGCVFMCVVYNWSHSLFPLVSQVLSPTYKQRNEDFRKLFKQLPDTERLIVDYSCALQRDILLQGRLYLSENWICFYSNIFRWETLKDVCSMTKEKTARLIPNAIQLCTDSEKHFFTSFGARDRTYMMMFRLWQNALLDKVRQDMALYPMIC
uniref:GRAM domain-containing protein n=1 Tax=Sinocyclocheilus anshuiensis TaxID=1608454 RepID=A0A671KM19_9TELE